MAKVSLLMLAYQGVRFIKPAIQSVINQTYKDWELIVVDDCSTDGTSELLSVLVKQDSRIKLYQTPKNLGTPAARKFASQYCTGEFIAHIDCDDLLERWAVEEMITAFHHKPQVALIYSDYAQIGVKNNIEGYNASKDFDPTKLYQHGWRHFGMYRSSVLKEIQGYNDKLITCEDGDLFMQIAERYPILRMPKILYFYRNHGDNNSLSNKKCNVCDRRPDCNYFRVWTGAYEQWKKQQDGTVRTA